MRDGQRPGRRLAREGRLATFTWLAHVFFSFRKVPDDGLVPSNCELDPDMRPVNILCMDGGGIRGRCLLAMVEEMEDMLGSPVASHFDLIAGTSIGGCGALFISHFPAKGEAARMGRTALRELATRCFADKSAWRLFQGGYLCADARREFMLELCGAAPLAAGGPRAFAVAARRKADGKGGLEPFLFRTYEVPRADGHEDGTLAGISALPGTHAGSLCRAVEATSAAPVLFPRTRLDHVDMAAARSGGIRRLVRFLRKGTTSEDGVHGDVVDGGAGESSFLADGGLVANDPSALALREARWLWPRRPIGTVVSLGTGNPSALRTDDDGVHGEREAAGCPNLPHAAHRLPPPSTAAWCAPCSSCFRSDG